MCLVFVAWRAHPRYRLIVAANRDEYHARPTAPAAPWGEAGRGSAADPVDGATDRSVDPSTDGGDTARGRILAGRDLKAGGTWLGVRADGRFAALTNYRGAVPPAPGAPSRGRLVADYLQGGPGARSHARVVAREAGRYRGFNLLLADRDDLLCVTNRGEERAMEVAPGCHGLGNDRLNAPCPKVAGGLAEFRRVLRSDFEPGDLFAVLADDEPVSGAERGGSGIERAHSARFIRGEVYGTRSSTVLLVHRDGAIVFEERSFDARAFETGRVGFERPPAAGADFVAAWTSLPVREAVTD